MESLKLVGATHQMIRMVSISATSGVIVLASVMNVSAQQAGRGFVAINGGYVIKADFTDNVVFTEFAEEGTLTANYGPNGGSELIDVGGGVRVWQNLAVGVAVSAFAINKGASVTAQIPHPFYFDRDRQITAQGQSGPIVGREEKAVHFQGIWMMPVNEVLEVAVFGGPTFFNIKQDLVTAVLFDQAYPYDTVSYRGATIGQQSGSKVGFNVGVDVSVYFSGNVGVGGLVRFSRSTIRLPSEGGGTVAVDTGGIQMGGGLRVRF